MVLLERKRSERHASASDSLPAAAMSPVDGIFGMKTVQRTQCLTGAPDERHRESRTFQVAMLEACHGVT